ncbi:hypothetical protein [Aliamphritea hakodatensis]|uniref:hypothetical protein n=1 Tax=Aliamphritea hakodatensis TaxID=2895352 RepID=UPI0022FD6190|nr:hypothetical protein [Aliamphritea hakodatensis]
MPMEFKQDVTIGEQKGVVKELSLADIRKMMKEEVTQSGDDSLSGVDAVIEQLLIPGVTVPQLKVLTEGFNFDEMRPSEIHELKRKCEEVNPDFFAIREMVQAVAREM